MNVYELKKDQCPGLKLWTLVFSIECATKTYFTKSPAETESFSTNSSEEFRPNITET